MYDWCKNWENFPIVPPFIGGTGFQIDVTHGATKTPFGPFCLYITKDVVKKKKRVTNRCVQSIINQKVTTVILPSILVHMTIFFLKKKNKDYWNTDITIKTAFAQMMPRSRFLSVLSFSHLNNNETQVPRGRENHDPLHKIRSFFNHLKQVRYFFFQSFTLIEK